MIVRKVFSLTAAVVLILLTTSVPLGAQDSAQGVIEDWATADVQKIWGLMQTWGAVKYNFVYFDQVSDLDWDAEVQAAIPRVLAARDKSEYYKTLGELTALLNDGHSFVLPRSVIRGQETNPPVEFQVVQDKIVLARVGSSPEIQAQTLRPGLELVEVGDGIPAREYLYDHALRYYPGGTKQWGEAIGMMSFLSGPEGSIIKLRLRDLQGNCFSVELTRDSRNADGTPFKHRKVDFPPFVEVRLLEDGIVYFRLASFASEQVVADFEREFEQLDLNKVTGMILDVRFNMGGNSANAFSIVSHLIDKPVETARWKTRQYLPARYAWGQPEEWYEEGPGVVEPAGNRTYAGPIVVLVGPNTCSAAEDFLVPLDYSDRALLVGERTAGSTGNPVMITLPGGGLLQVCSKRDSYPDGRQFVGFGIEPDIEVRVTQEDIFEDRDRALERAVEVIRARED